MAINTDMVGQTFGPFVRDYAFRDLELFALGCGAGIDGKNGLEYLNEHDERDPKLKVLPMFGAMLIVDSEVTRTIDYGYNYAGSLHWGFDIRFHRPIVKMSDRLETKVKLKGLYDRGEGRGLLAQHIGDTIGTQNPGNDETGKTGDFRQNDREKTEPRKRCPDQETAEKITPPQQARLEHENILSNHRPGTTNIPRPQKRNQDGAQKCPRCHRKETGPPAKELVNEHGQRNAQHRRKHKPRQDNRRRLPTEGGANRLDTHRQ